MSKVKFVTPVVVSFGIIYIMNQKCRNDACKHLVSNIESSWKNYTKDHKSLVGLLD
jgi:hypothetical protein